MRKINGAGRMYSIISESLLLENDPKIRYLSFEDHYISIHLLKEKTYQKKSLKMQAMKYKSRMVIRPDK